MEGINELIKDYEDKLPDNVIEEIKSELGKRKLSKKDTEKIFEYLREQYERAKISPGEAIGIVTAESFGEPGTQMSVAADERLIIKVNGGIKIVEIGKLINYLISIKGSLKINEHSEILPLNDLDIYVPSINEDEKIEWKKAIECSRHKSPKRLIKIKTASGRKIIATDNHSFVTRINNKIIPIKGNELKRGIRLPVLSYLPVENKSNLDIKQYLKEGYVFENEQGQLETRYHAKPIPRFIELNENTGWFIGAYLAEGSSNKGQVSISNINDDYISNAKAFTERIGLEYKEDFHHRGFAPGRDLKISSALLSKFIVTSCGKGSDFKKVPEFAFSASNEFVSGLLRGYFDGDGNFHVDRKMIRTSSNSEELIDGVSLLLRRFRIFSFKTKDKKGQYWLLIPYKYAPLFLEFIGSDIDYKREALERLAEKSKNFWSSRSQDYTDMISGFGNLFYYVAKRVGMPTRYVNNFTKRQKIGRTTLYRYVKKFEQLAREKNIDIGNELAIMYRMFNSDVIWDEITDIEYVDSEHEYVYDLSVPGLETFTTFDGVITHNTLNVFHFAGVAEVSVTQGLPRLIEILDARKEISTPSMEIYIKAPYNKDADEVRKVAASVKETKLNELVSEFTINLTKMQIELLLNKERMKEFKVTEDQLVKVLSENIKNASFKSGDNNKVIAKLKQTENELVETYKLKEKLKDVFVKGVKGISQVLPVKLQNEFVIITSGSNLKDVIKIKEVDETRTVTNDLFEVIDVLGIEAARQTIINEVFKVIEDQGLDVDVRHIMFIADVMTTGGNIKGITRSGITGEKKSVLARASFETPLKPIISASLIGEDDELNSVIENVMLNQPVPLGTGLPDLVAKMKVEEKDESS